MFDPSFSDAVKDALGEGTAGNAAIATGLSHALVYDMARGRVPKRQTLIRFADGLSLTGEVRSRLFYAAGYLDPQDVPETAGVA